MHLQTWQDKPGNAPPLTDPTTGLTFPEVPEVLDHPPTNTEGAALGVAKFLTAMGLFSGQSPDFFAGVKALGEAADAEQRQ